MLGKLWTRMVRSGYLGQVVTAGVLLTTAALLLFAVIGTLQPAAKPPAAKTAPVSEALPPAEATAHKVQPADTAHTEQPQLTAPEPVAQPVQPAAETAAAAAGNAAVQQLWQGTVTHKFGWQLHPLYQDWRYHNGIDISGGEGQLVPALLGGQVVDVYTDKQYGLTVAVKSGQYTLYYSSLASTSVQKGAAVKSGKVLGSMGITLAEPEPHLHLAIQKSDGKSYVDPGEVFPQITI